MRTTTGFAPALTFRFPTLFVFVPGLLSNALPWSSHAPNPCANARRR